MKGKPSKTFFFFLFDLNIRFKLRLATLELHNILSDFDLNNEINNTTSQSERARRNANYSDAILLVNRLFDILVSESLLLLKYHYLRLSIMSYDAQKACFSSFGGLRTIFSPSLHLPVDLQKQQMYFTSIF
jgi:hypothetical protein